MKGVGRMYNGVTLWQPVFLWNWERPVSSQLPSEAARLCGTRVWKPHLLKDTVETEIQGSPWKGHSPSWDRQSLLPPVYPHHPLSNSWRCEFSRWCDIGAVTPCHPIGLASDLEYHLVTVPSLLRLGLPSFTCWGVKVCIHLCHSATWLSKSKAQSYWCHSSKLVFMGREMSWFKRGLGTTDVGFQAHWEDPASLGESSGAGTWAERTYLCISTWGPRDSLRRNKYRLVIWTYKPTKIVQTQTNRSSFPWALNPQLRSHVGIFEMRVYS